MTDQGEQSGPRTPSAPVSPAAREEMPSWRLLVTLGSAGALAGLLIVVAYRATQPTIRAHKAEMLRQAIQEVLKAPERYDTLYVYDGSLVKQVPGGVDARQLERVYLGYRDDRERAGFAITASGAGFQDVVKLIFGYDLTTSRLLGMKVLESKETPGLGNKIDSDPRFGSQFDGALAPLVGVKRSGGGATDPSQIVMITGATISSRAVIRMIDDRLERLKPLLEAYREDASP